MNRKDTTGGGDNMPNVGMSTPVGKGVEAATEVEGNGGGKGKKLGIKRVKKKPDLNMSKGKLKSVTTPKNFSFLNMSVQKQTLRANNRALAQNLAKARQEIRRLNTEVHTLRSNSQEQILELNRLKRLVGLKDEQIQVEVQQRIQDEMKEMRSLLDELTQSMMSSSTFITKMHDKCLMYCSRRSTDSSRSVSLGNNQSMNRSRSRPSFKEIGNKDDLIAKYLSKADECTAPPGGRVFNNYNHESDMSLIAEQSMIDGDLYTAHPLVSVDETISEISPIETAPAQPMSKLPQRILKYSDPKPKDFENTTSSLELGSETSERSDKSEKEMEGKEASVKEKDSSDKEKELCKSKTNKGKDDKLGKEKDSVKIKDRKYSKMKEKERGAKGESKVKRMEEVKTLNEKDSNIEGDVSAFGFGGNFAADLVSGSPITAEKRRETFVLPKQTVVTDLETKKEKNKKGDTFVKPNANLETNTKGKKNLAKHNTVKGSVKGNKDIARQKVETSSSKLKRRDTYATENPFVPKCVNISRSPEKTINEESMVYNNVENPFKPTKTLLRSPIHINVESASPEKKVDSLAFLARFRESLEKRPEESSPLPEPTFPDEPTTYFNSEMEFTSVIDSTKLLQTLRRSEKNSPVSSGESKITSVDHIDLSNDKPKSAMNSIAEKDQSQHESSETAAVEVRTKKPGVFTFSVGRKEADGSRKPVPEKISKARSKKKKPVTPEKEERKTGSDRDMFNFGDRTPTVPLEKLAAKTKNVYDLSMNESVAAVPVTLNNFKDKKNVPETVPDGQIYYAPLKDCSPDEKPTSRKARSQSRSRSKSRKKDDDDDDDWVPGAKPRGRSKSRSRKTDDDQKPVRRGRSQSRKRVATETETDENEEEKSRGRSKSRSLKIEKEEIIERPSRSRSCRRVSKPERYNDDTEEEIDEPLSRRCRSRSRGRVLKDGSAEENNNDDEKESEALQAEIENNSIEKYEKRSGRSKTKRVESENGEESDLKEVRRGRSRSRARSKILDAELDDYEHEKEKLEPKDLELDKTSPPPCRSARSKLNAKKPLYDEDSDVDESPLLRRKSRSRPLKSRKTFEINNDDSDNELERKSERLTESKKADEVHNIVVLDSDESESSGKEKSKHSKTTSNEEVEGDIVIEESESESERVPKIEQFKPRRRVKSINYSDDHDDDNDSNKNDESKSKNRKSENKKTTEDNLDENIGRNLDFVNKRRGKSLRNPDDDSESKGVDTDGVVNLISERLRDHEMPPDSPVVNKKEEKKAAKSVKKSTRKRKPSGQETTGKSKKNIAEKLDSEENEKSSVTPAVLPDTSKKSSKTSGRSSKKVKAERLLEQTPVLKEDKSNSLVSDKPDALALLKKRLTMVGNKHIVKEDANTDVRKRSQADLGGQDNEGCASPEKRTKRNKNPVSYVPKPLNVKLRRGDDLFKDSGSTMSKVKAEQSRLLIAKKTTVPKVSIDDKENVMQTWPAS